MLNPKTRDLSSPAGESRFDERGFTLLEMIVAIGIFALISLSISWFIINAFRYNAIIWEQLKTQSDGRRVVQNVVDYVRKAEESSIGGYPIGKVDDYELVFYANVDDDSNRERVRFWLDGTTLNRGIIEPSGDPIQYVSSTEVSVQLAHDVVNIAKSTPLFYYYDQNYSGTEASLVQPVNIPDVRVVRVQLELEKDPDKTPVPLRIESVVSVRNLKSN